MYLLKIDDATVFVSTDSELIVHEINKSLAPFRRYGGLNFEIDGKTMKVFYGSMPTNLVVECQSEYEALKFKAHHPGNF